jgi:hypothetical protein
VSKLKLLRSVLLVKVVMTFALWGIPALVAPPSLLQLFDLYITDYILLRMMGGVVIAMGIAYWFAYKDPERNIAVLWMGVVDNGLATLVILYFGFTSGIPLYWWITAVATLFFTLAFLYLMPKEKDDKKKFVV